MKIKTCYYCNKKTALLPISTMKNKNLRACFDCYNEKAEKGELPPIENITREELEEALDMLVVQELPEGTKGNMSKIGQTQQPHIYTKYGRDLTQIASVGGLDPVVGREKEIKRAIQILTRRTKNNPVFVGAPGVGKTAIAEGIAQKIVNKEVPGNLADKRIFLLDLASVVAGAKYRGEFEERLKTIVEEIKEQKNIILFVDEIHTIVGAGGAEGSIDASNILKPPLARSEIQMMGATTSDEYRKYIEKDAALERRLQSVEVTEPTGEETVAILEGLREKYESYHGVSISPEAIEAAVELSQKYITERFLPDKAIDLIDESCALYRVESEWKSKELIAVEKELTRCIEMKTKAIQEQDFETAQEAYKEEMKLNRKLKAEQTKMKQKQQQTTNVITKEKIAEVVSTWTGIPVTQLSQEEKQRMKTLAEDLKQSVIGQEEAVISVAKAIRRSKAGLKEPNRPIGAFLLSGPTGVGKTELAKSLANLVYGSEENMIRFDMSEYMSKHEVSKLLGAPPGYVGFEDEGELTKKLRKKPYSVVLFDEIEKAHPDVMNIFLQIFEDGRLTDTKGRTINAKNAIFLLTTNAGSDAYQQSKSLGFDSNEKTEERKTKDRVMEVLKGQFRPEFLNRLDDVLVFNKLSKGDMIGIAKKMVNQVVARAKTNDITIKFSEKAIEHLAEIGYKPEYGARPLRREVEKIVDMITDKRFDEEDKDVFSVGVKTKDGKTQFHIK